MSYISHTLDDHWLSGKFEHNDFNCFFFNYYPGPYKAINRLLPCHRTTWRSARSTPSPACQQQFDFVVLGFALRRFDVFNE